MKLNVLAFGAHPDDVELCAGGTLAKHVAMGYACGIVDLTLGDLGTRGTVEIRLAEAQKAAEILGLSVRENLKFRDGFFQNDEAHQLEVIRMLRKYQPDVILANALYDRHPDHGRGSDVVKTSVFLAGLAKIKTFDEGVEQAPWRPRSVYHYIQFRPVPPQLIVDISGYEEIKMQSILAHASQVYNPNSDEPSTVVASKAFLDSIENRSAEWGLQIGAAHGEAFSVERLPGIKDLTQLL